MPTFATPEPITASIEVVSGSVHVVASDREDTVVQVSPRDPNRASDVRVAEGARVDFRNGTLAVSAGRRFISLGRGGAVVVDIELPSRSRLQVSSASAQVRADGEFGDCRFATRQWGRRRRVGRGKHQGGQRLRRDRRRHPDGHGGDLDRVGRRHASASSSAMSSSAPPAALCRSGTCRALSTPKPHPVTSPSRPRPTAGCRCRRPVVRSRSASPKARRPGSTCARIQAKCATRLTAVRRARPMATKR